MNPQLFPTLAANGAVTALIGSNPVRCYPFGLAPENVAKPYAVWRIVSGRPENYLGTTPDIDTFTTQIDIYAESLASARNVATAMRNAIEPVAHITRWGGESRDLETMNYRINFDVDWFASR